MDTLKKYKREYYNAESRKEKDALKERIRAYTKTEAGLFSDPSAKEKQLAEFGSHFDNPKHSHTFFDPALMMGESRGFDIVIGNPPYIDSEAMTKISSELRESIVDIYELTK